MYQFDTDHTVMYWYITVHHGIYKFTVYPITTHHEGSTADFRGAHRDAAARVILEPPAQSSVEQDEVDACPEPEDEEFFQGPDTEGKEEAINKFLDGMEDQERSGFKGIDRLLGRLPVPAGKKTRSMSYSEARAGEFLPDMDNEEQKRFTPSELLIYKHALEYMYIL
jgi:hypothetical protein